jgi:hypothetical protein
MSSTAITMKPRELAHREGDGIAVTLYWHGGDSLSVVVFDARTSNQFELDVEPSMALEVYYHPFAHAPYSVTELACIES